MLGINAPKVIAKGEYARAVREAARAAAKVKADDKNVEQEPKYGYKFIWRV